ncbi:hypothetical protein ACGFRB_23615 [Streptomyces sp. NPDC048718]|uniref:hypothetical protein n=1 Tax=Streptomyces sp. NPDC048718 TaxID=3365587 RepID=UPI00371A4133
MFGRRKAKNNVEGLGPAGVPWLDYPQWPREQQPEGRPDEQQPVVDDFLPESLRIDPDRNRFMVWPSPLVVEGEVRTCTKCGLYRNFAILATQGRIWLRCPVGHTTLDPALDIAWYNRHSGPADATFGSLEEGLRGYGLA